MSAGKNKTWNDMCKEEKTYVSMYTISIMLSILFLILFIIGREFYFILLTVLFFVLFIEFCKKYFEVLKDIDTANNKGISLDEWKRIKNWYKWDDSIHYSQKQAERLDRAANDDLKIKYINQKHGCGFVIGTTGKQYNVFLDHCNCPDFKRRQKPCKHMYRLALELGIIDGPYC